MDVFDKLWRAAAIREAVRGQWLRAAPVAGRPVPYPWLVFGLLGVVLFMRQPLDVLAPQLNAEEGVNFFQEAYNRGFVASFFSSEAGYYHLLLRLTAGIALLAPLELVPFVFKFVSFAVQMLPVAYLLADGVAGFVAAPALRVVVALLYVGGPNSSEIYINANNAQWHLTLAAALILLTGRRPGKLRNAVDTGVLAIFSLTGPFSLVCVPLAVWRWWRDGGIGVRGARNTGPIIVVAGALVEAAYLLCGQRLAGGAEALAAPSLLETFRILGVHGTLNSLLGMHFMWREAPAFPAWAVVAAAAALPLLAMMVVRLRNPALAVLGYLAAASVAVMFFFPLNDPRAWLNPAFGPRYFFFTTLVILYTLLAMVERGGWGRWLAAPLLTVALTVGMRGDFFVPALPDNQWRDQVAAFRMRSSGENFYIPIHPYATWGVTLVRKGGTEPKDMFAQLERSEQPLLVMLAPAQEANPEAAERMITFGGFAVDIAGKAAEGVTLLLDGRPYPAVTGIDSPEAAAALNNPAARAAGFSRSVPLKEIGPGVHRVEIWAHDHDRNLVQRSAPAYVQLFANNDRPAPENWQ
jgi:hypothetical protein